MNNIKRLEKLIQENLGFLRKYEDALAANPNDFGAKLMVGNVRAHLQDLDNQKAELLSAKASSGPTGIGPLAALSA